MGWHSIPFCEVPDGKADLQNIAVCTSEMLVDYFDRSGYSTVNHRTRDEILQYGSIQFPDF